ncbi:hypothetical protein V3C99_001221, partial [Haemonchus contortus]
MLFIFAVLSSVVAFVAAQGKSSPLPDDAKEALQYINGANHEDIRWDESLAQNARKWVDTPNIVKVDLAIKGKECFKKTDERSWFIKTITGFEYQINDEYDKIEALGRAPHFGCGGVLNAQLTNYDCLTIVCLYRK